MNDDNMSDNNSERVKKSTLIIAIFATVIATVISMEMNDLIKHNDKKEDYPVSEYRAIFIEKQPNKQYRLSHKQSDQTAICNNGYLFITSDVDDGMQGLLVDYKNRGVRCISAESKVRERP